MRRSRPNSLLGLAFLLGGVLLVPALAARLLADDEVPAAAEEAEAAEDEEGRTRAITGLPRLPDALHAAMQGREFDEAIGLVDGLLKNAKFEHRDYLRYLRIRALVELGRHDAALAACDSFEKEHEASPWAARVRFARADVFQRIRNYQEAAEIYRAEAQRLLSDDRRDELAEISLEYANRYFEGIPADDPSKAKQPDYAQAKTYFLEALKLEPSTATRHVVEYRIARSHQELDEHDAAINAYRAYLKQYADDETPDEQRAPEKLEAHARYELGRALLAAGRRDEARRVWQDFVASDLSKTMQMAAEKSEADLRPQAMYRIGQTYGLPSPSTTDDLELGVAAHERFLKEYPEHELAPRAEFDIARGQVQHGRYDDAIARLNSLIANPAYAKRAEVARARRLLGQVYLDQQKFDEAIAAWKAFLEAHPTDSAWSEVQQNIVDAEYAKAAHLRAEKQYAAARTAWETFLNKYPLDPRAPQILLEFGRMQHEQAVAAQKEHLAEIGPGANENVVVAEATALFEAAISDWRRLVEKYPNTAPASEAAFLVATTLEDELGRLEEALAAYRRVNGDFQDRANKRIHDLTGKNLELVTERKFRSNEKPTVRVVTRNLEKVTVKTYRIDLGDYFRKMQAATGLEGLDIALIDPDATTEHVVEKYEKYRRIVSHVPVALDGPGVVAVTVTAGELESTTMVIVSDLDVIAKASRNELFVFAQDTPQRKPLEGVQLLVSNGEKVFGEPLTAAEGISRETYEELKTAGELRLFAEHEGHVAFTTVSLDGLEFAAGLAPRGYLHTDRPAYRPGQLVHLKGIVRWVDGDAYTFTAGEKYRLDVYDPRSRRLHSKDVTLDEFGCVDDRFTLPDGTPAGNCRVHLHQPGGEQSYETAFQVATYRLEPVRIEIETERTVFYRGETIEGTIKLAYQYGSPLAERSVTYRIADEPWQTATTNEKGEVPFAFETRSFRESTPLNVVVQYPDRGIATAKTVFLATRGFAIGASTLRGVYIAGETFDVNATVADPSGEPVATDLTLDVLELVTDTKPVGEKRIAQHELKSDEGEGKATHTVRLDEPGRYLLRFTGTDRFGNDVTGGTVVSVSGDDDTVRLRILADKHHFQVGDEAKVQLHWRDDEALALVTYEGARILGHRLVTLKQGANALAVPLDASLAPNFVLSVAVMDLESFHQARSEFLVRRRLAIEVKPSAETVEPGSELKVEITTKDAQGNPVAAEVSLGMIERSLLERFGSGRPFVETFFGNDRRRPAMRAASSVVFEYRPETEGVSEFLLAENRRRNDFEQEREAIDRLARGEEAALGLLLNDDVREQMHVEQSGVAMDDVAGWKGRFARRIAGPYDSSSFESGGIRLYDFDGDGTITAEELAQRPQVHAGHHFVLERLWNAVPQGGTQLGRWESLDTNGVYDARGLNELYGRFRQESGHGISAYDPMYPNYWGMQSSGNLAGGGYGGAMLGGANGSVNGNLPYLSTFGRPASGIVYSQDGAANTTVLQSFDAEALAVGDGRRGDRFGEVRDWSERKHHLIQLFNDTTVDFTSATKLSRLDDTIVALNGRGEQFAVNGLPPDRLVELSGEGTRLLPGQSRSETGYWNPTTITSDKGTATLTFRMPERSTAWTLQAVGTSKETLTGDATADVTAKKPLFADIRAPLAFREGDTANVLVEVHDSIVEKGKKIEVAFTATIGERSSSVTKSFDATGGIEELAFPVTITPGDEVEFTAVVRSGDHGSTSSETVPVLPFGLPVFATASGTASQTTLAFVQHDERNPVQRPRMEIVIGPSLERMLLDAVTGTDVNFYGCGRIVESGLARAASDVLGGVAVLQAARDAKDANGPDLRVLTDRIRSRLAELVAAQRDDGGWSWSGSPTGNTDTPTTADAVWALAAAREAGFAVPNETLANGVAVLNTAMTAARDGETRALLLHALARADAATFTQANRLFRERTDLSPEGVLYTALALGQLDRASMGLALLRGVDLPEQDGDPRQLALHLLALDELLPGDELTPKVAERLIGRRVGTRWTPERANGPAIAALSRWFAKAQRVDEKYTLGVFVNDRLVEKLEIDPAKDAARRLEVDPRFLEGTKRHRVNFDLEGRGTFGYSVVLDGFVPADEVTSTTDAWTVTRTYEPALRTLDGRDVARGFGIVESGSKTFRNPLTQLPVGDRGHVRLTIDRKRATDNQPLDYLVVTEPVPAGATVVEDSVTGGFERFEIVPGGIQFHVGQRAGRITVDYAIVGYEPGKYRAVPTTVRSHDVPDRLAVTGVESLTVLARGEKSVDEYRLSPVELLEFGKGYVIKGDHDSAWVHLHDLHANWELRADTATEVNRLLFREALALNKDGEIVEFFEILRQRDPDYVIEYTDVLRVARAYSELGEYERSFLVYRATIEGRFSREAQIVGWLAGQGEFLRSVGVMERLLHGYPAEAYVAMSTYALSQEVYGKAAEARDDEKLRERKVTRIDLLDASVRMVDHFLTTWPRDPAADEAAFAIANTLLDLERYEEVVKRASAFVDRYPESKLIDGFWFVVGYGQFALGKPNEALATCEKVSKMTRLDPETGREVPADNKWQALYIMGQIHHSLGHPAEAITLYEEVKTRFVDAAEAIRFFLDRRLEFPEVTTVAPGEEAKPELEFKNVASVNVKVYRIDLLKFGLLRRDLTDITSINLAGIRPFHDSTVKLGDGKDYTDRTRALDLPITDDGAYLVVCRGGDLYASGLVLVSPLELKVAEDVESKRVRVTVKDTKADKYAKDVHVKVIGARNDDFTSGESDLRGVFVADDIRGTVTVIAKEQDAFAFYRGPLREEPPAANQPEAEPNATPEGEDGESATGKLLEQLRLQNGFNNSIQRQNYKELLDNVDQGVEAKKAL